jgi:4'-phosphopantetheinyl transferase
MLRALLSRYVHRPPAHIVIAYGAHGKPEIVGDGRAGIHFNVSHSCDRVVYAVARGRRVGIDVERMRQVASLSRIARRYFSPSEHLALQALPEDRRVAAFFRCWTRKEALVKASGDGVSHAIHRLDVDMCDSARSMNIAGWVLDDLPTDEGYVAAVAVEAHA